MSYENEVQQAWRRLGPLGERETCEIARNADTQIAALTEKLRAVEAERDDVCLMLVRSTSTKSTLTSIAIENLQHIARLERGEAEREAHLEAGARELSALRTELERKDAALKAAESLAHWSNELIMHLEREFGPQPRFSSGHIGKICAAVREFRAALQPKEPPCQKA